MPSCSCTVCRCSQNLAIVQRIKALADKKGCTAGQLALAWVHAQGEDVFPIPGALLRAAIVGRGTSSALCVCSTPHAGLVVRSTFLQSGCAVAKQVGAASHEAMASARQAACFKISASRHLKSMDVPRLGLFPKFGRLS